MSRNRAALGKGLLLGVAVGALWIAAQRSGAAERARDGEPAGDLLDWEWATRVALRTCGQAPRLHPVARARLEQEYRAMLAELEEPIAAYTRTHLSLERTAVRVMDRPDWIHANIANFRELFAPMEVIFQDATHNSPLQLPGLKQVGRALLSSQVGVLLGYLARRVLGQYDISLLGKEPLESGKLYFVEPNIQALQAMMQAPPDELRRWIALHEATHAHEFEVYPWLRQYMNQTLQGYFRSVADELGGSSDQQLLGQLGSRLWRSLREGRGLFDSLLSPRQQRLVSRLQALMCLVEGYSNQVMHAVGSRLLPHYPELKAQLERRQRQRSPAEDLFMRLTGLRMKLDQYALGERFVAAVVEARGVEFVNLAWRGPESLPTEEEIRHPERWIARMEAAL